MNDAGDFTPPTAEQLSDHLVANMPRIRRGGQMIAMLVLMAVLVGLWLSEPTPLTVTLPWLILLGLLVWGVRQNRRRRQVQVGIRRVYELTALHHHAEAVRAAWKLLPHLRPFPDTHVQTTMLMAMNLGALRAYDPALAAMEYLLAHVDPEHPIAQMLRAQRCIALLHEDRLTDADEELRRMGRMQLSPVAGAVWRAAQLHQQLKTLRFEDLVRDVEADDPMRQMWLLGVDAGTSYGMIAVAYHQVHRADEAAKWWRRATMLQSPRDIVESVPDVAPTLQLPPALTLSQAMREDKRD